MEEWNSISAGLPEDSKFIMANVKDNNYVYHEILCYKEKLDKWYFITGGELPSDIIVTAWKNLPSTYQRG
ncbi:hypothetical protein ACSBL2_15045 [Pedobacter sp. AW31-3R]|uniref:hypothetical protein n=1 Tax=Pedobacter sp. AW31-3R TaxID=3445781 RepID=UPI003FA027FC